jgi:N-acetylneuraminate lyase
MSTFSGIWPALVTPFTDTNHLNTSVLIGLVEYLLEKQVDGFYIGGTTGQGLLLSVDERKQLAELVLKVVNGRVPVIVHVGAVALVDAIALARHACDKGASGISSLLLPEYPDVPDLINYIEALSSSVHIPFLAYIYGRDLNAVDLMERLMGFETVIGAKYTGPNMYELKRVIGLGRDEAWTVFSGMDEQSVFAAVTGAAGHIGSTLNFMPGAYRAMHQLVRRSEVDAAYSLQTRANAITDLLIAAGFSGGLYFVMERLGFACGRPRLPHKALSPEDRRQLGHLLDASDFAELAAY